MHRQSCPLCQSKDRSLLFDYGRGRNFDTLVCNDCGFAHVAYLEKSVQGDENDDKEGYRKHPSFALDPETISGVLEKEQRAASMAERRYENLKTKAPEIYKRKGNMYDIGASIGLFMKHWKDDGFNVFGCEPDQYYAEIGKAHFNFDIEPILYEMKDPQPEYYDVITLCHVLEHCPDPRGILKHIHRELNPDGSLYIEIPAIDSPYGGNLKRFFWIEHINYFSAETLVAALALEGFEVKIQGRLGFFLWVVAKRSKGDHTIPSRPYNRPDDVKQRMNITYLKYIDSQNVRLQAQIDKIFSDK